MNKDPSQTKSIKRTILHQKNKDQEDEEIKQKIQTITEKYINKKAQDIPRYMSPTIVARTKVDLKKNNIYDCADKPTLDNMHLRKSDKQSYSPHRHL